MSLPHSVYKQESDALYGGCMGDVGRALFSGVDASMMTAVTTASDDDYDSDSAATLTSSASATPATATATATSSDDLLSSRLYRQRRREAHTHAEQKRRDSIRRGYELLQELVPGCQGGLSSSTCTGYGGSPSSSPAGGAASSSSSASVLSTTLSPPLPATATAAATSSDTAGSEAASSKSATATAAASTTAAAGGCGGGARLSKATVLQRSIDYTEQLVQRHTQLKQKLDSVRRELLALQILRTNYQQLARSQQSVAGGGVGGVGGAGQCSALAYDQLRFSVFRAICDQLFESFDASIQVDDFAQLTSSMIMWMEEEMTPHALRQMCINVVSQLKSIGGGGGGGCGGGGGDLDEKTT